MKKFILPILLFLMLIPFYVYAETCDTDKITISSITMENNSDNVEELEAATASGKNIKLNLSMTEVGDNIEYKFIVKNDSNEDYELDKMSLNINSDYINYSFVIEDDSNVVKANSSKNVILRVEYKNEVPEDKFESGTYKDNKTMMVQLSNGNTINVPDTFKNPNTEVQSYILVIFILLLISGSLYVLLKKKKYTKFMILVIGIAIIIPMSVYALCKVEIKFDSNVTIKKENIIVIKDYGYCSYEPVFINRKIIGKNWLSLDEGVISNMNTEEKNIYEAFKNKNIHDNNLYFIINDNIPCDSFSSYLSNDNHELALFYGCRDNNRKVFLSMMDGTIFEKKIGYYVIDKNLCNIPAPVPIDPPVSPIIPTYPPVH